MLYRILLLFLILNSMVALANENHSQIIQEEELTDAIFPRTDPKIIGLIYQMLKVIDEVFMNHHIPYWIDGGTALGAVRHQGCIPWDDDADLVFYSEDESRILALANKFSFYGFCLKKEHILRLYPAISETYPFIDLAGYCLYPDQTLRFQLDWARLYYDQFYWLPEEVETLVKVPFGPLMLNAPKEMQRYLLTGYGNDCFSHAIFPTYHRGEQNQIMVNKKVRLVDYSPASYEIENLSIPLELSTNEIK